MSGLRSGLGSRRCGQWKVFIVHVHGDEVGRVWFRRPYIVAMRGGNKDRATGVSSLANEEPLMVVKTRVDVVWEVIRKDCGDGRSGMVWKGKTSLCRGGRGSVLKGARGAKNRDISCGWSRGGHRGSEVFATRGGEEDIVGVNGDVFVERGEKEGVEDFLSYLGGSRRHG